MKTPKLLQRGIILWRNPEESREESAHESTALPELCPVARCARCGYEFTAHTVSAVCPRCLEPFTREQCYGGCFACPLLAGSTSER
jgi:rubrerythrin